MKKLFIILQGFQLIAFSAQNCSNEYVYSDTAIIVSQGWFSDKYEYPITHAEVKCTKVTLTSTAEVSYFNSNSYETYFIVNSSSVSTLFAKVFQQIPKTAVITMSNNFIKNIETSAFAHLKILRVVNLQFNNLTTIQDGIFESNKALETLDLSYNSILSIGNAFPASSLRTLKLQHNKLHCVDFKLPTSLTYLDLSYNEIDSIKKESLFGLTSLDSLFINNNYLKTIPVGCFKDLKQLKQLDLSNNKLKIVFGMFSGLQNANRLNMANNSINRLPEAALSNLVNLVDLNIEDNLISKLDGDAIKKHLSALKTIGLKGNKFACNYLAELIVDLKKYGTVILNGIDFFTNNIQGIACADIQDVTTEKADYVQNDTKQQTELLQDILKSLNTLSQYDLKNAIKDFFQNNSKIAEKSEERINKLNEAFLAEFRDFSRIAANDTQQFLMDFLGNATDASLKNYQEIKKGFNESFVPVWHQANSDFQTTLTKSFEELKHVLQSSSNLNVTREIGERLISALSVNNNTRSDLLVDLRMFLNESNKMLQNFTEEMLKHYEETKYFQESQVSTWKQMFNESEQLLAENFKPLFEALQKKSSDTNLSSIYLHQLTNQSFTVRISDSEIQDIIENIYNLLLGQKNATEAMEDVQKFHKRAWFNLDGSLLHLLCHLATLGCIFIIMLTILYQSCVKCWSYKERRYKSDENVNEMYGFVYNVPS